MYGCAREIYGLFCFARSYDIYQKTLIPKIVYNELIAEFL